MKLRLIDAQVVGKLIDAATVTETVEAVFRAFGQGEAHMPAKVYLNVPEGDFRAMPAYIPGAAGVKWINVHTKNPERGTLPTVMGLILYNDPETGRPLALIDGTLITKYRTGAAAAVAARHLARPGARTLGLVGCGGQAEIHLAVVAQALRPEEILLADARRENAERVAAHFPHLPCRVVGIEEACAADVICTLTPSHEPVVRRAWIRPGTHINAMGADAPGKQELETELLLAGRVFVDDWEQASHSGEINVAYHAGRLSAVAGTLPDVLCGRNPGRTSAEEITIFDSTGLAIQDLAVAHGIYQEACRRGAGLEVEFALG